MKIIPYKCDICNKIKLAEMQQLCRSAFNFKNIQHHWLLMLSNETMSTLSQRVNAQIKLSLVYFSIFVYLWIISCWLFVATILIIYKINWKGLQCFSDADNQSIFGWLFAWTRISTIKLNFSLNICFPIEFLDELINLI